jgi:hypothetical protein
MSGFLADAKSWLAGQREDHMSAAAVYRRGAVSISLDAAEGATEYPADDGAGAVVMARSIDWIVSAAALTAGGVQLLPRKGDLVVAGGRTYEVVDLAAAGCWRWSGGVGIGIRVHTKEVG